MPLPAQDAQSLGEGPNAPQTVPPLIFDTFLGINTNASRPGIADEEMAWCDGFFPLGKNNLRTLPGVGRAIYTATVHGSVIWYDFANIGELPICVVFLADGSIVEVNTRSATFKSIAPAGTIQNPSRQRVGITQWGNQYIIIVADQPNGYFAWDGVTFYKAGSIAPLVNVTNSGINYTGPPTILVETTGSGSSPTFSAVLNNDVIEQINVINPGSGFGINDFINLVIQDGGSDDTAQATATIGPGGGIESIAVINGGDGYTIGDKVTITGGGGTGARAFANVVGTGPAGEGGQVQSITVVTPGSGYTASPTVTIVPQHKGSGAVLAANIFQGQITAINVTNPGTGYITPPKISIIGDGSGGEFLAEINSSGSITSVDVIDGGQGYTKALVHFSGGNNAAEATADLMPFGIKGTYAETFESRVWVEDGNKISFTTAESVADFSTSNGGGTIEATDSFLRNSYTALKQTNGFLYILADSSINYISGVKTTGTPPSTTFNNQNADPEIGTSWASAVDVLSRNIIFANTFGIHISYGGAVTKISDDLDGIYNTVANFGSFVPSAGKAIIFGKKVWCLLLPVIDPISGQQVNKLFMWTGKKWFTSQQDVNLIFIQHQELNSVLTTYGTDGTKIHPLFQQPSTGFTKTIQSKLWDRPGGYMLTKTASRIWGLLNFYDTGSPTINVSVDNETGNGNLLPVLSSVGVVPWVNALANAVAWKNNSAAAVTWYSAGTGIAVFAPDAVGQQGVLTGLTLQTNCADVALISLAVQADDYAYRG